MRRRFTPQMLRALRNDVNIDHLIAEVLTWPSKTSEGYFRFLCPICTEFNSATNPNTNLARCFRCEKNFNPIDVVMAIRGCTFVQAVEFLRTLQTCEKTRHETVSPPRPTPVAVIERPFSQSPQCQIIWEKQSQIM